MAFLKIIEVDVEDLAQRYRKCDPKNIIEMQLPSAPASMTSPTMIGVVIQQHRQCHRFTIPTLEPPSLWTKKKSSKIGLKNGPRPRWVNRQWKANLGRPYVPSVYDKSKAQTLHFQYFLVTTLQKSFKFHKARWLKNILGRRTWKSICLTFCFKACPLELIPSGKAVCDVSERHAGST